MSSSTAQEALFEAVGRVKEAGFDPGREIARFFLVEASAYTPQRKAQIQQQVRRSSPSAPPAAPAAAAPGMDPSWKWHPDIPVHRRTAANRMSDASVRERYSHQDSSGQAWGSAPVATGVQRKGAPAAKAMTPEERAQAAGGNKARDRMWARENTGAPARGWGYTPGAKLDFAQVVAPPPGSAAETSKPHQDAIAHAPVAVKAAPVPESPETAPTTTAVQAPKAETPPTAADPWSSGKKWGVGLAAGGTAALLAGVGIWRAKAARQRAEMHQRMMQHAHGPGTHYMLPPPRPHFYPMEGEEGRGGDPVVEGGETMHLTPHPTFDASLLQRAVRSLGGRRGGEEQGGEESGEPIAEHETDDFLHARARRSSGPLFDTPLFSQALSVLRSRPLEESRKSAKRNKAKERERQIQAGLQSSPTKKLVASTKQAPASSSASSSSTPATASATPPPKLNVVGAPQKGAAPPSSPPRSHEEAEKLLKKESEGHTATMLALAAMTGERDRFQAQEKAAHAAVGQAVADLAAEKEKTWKAAEEGHAESQGRHAAHVKTMNTLGAELKKNAELDKSLKSWQKGAAIGGTGALAALGVAGALWRANKRGREHAELMAAHAQRQALEQHAAAGEYYRALEALADRGDG